MKQFWMVAALFASSTGWAQESAIELAAPPCLPDRANARIAVQVADAPDGSSVRLYFRRLNPLGAFYYNRMVAAGEGAYWSVFPRPDRREQTRLSEEWWQELRDRDWMAGRDRDWLEGWLGEREHEAAEYYVAVVAGSGAPLARSDVRLVEVLDRADCPVELGPRERGWAWNLTVGETTELQLGRPVFHWLCDGIVTRIGWDGIMRADEICRVCVLGGAYPSPIPHEPEESSDEQE